MDKKRSLMALLKEYANAFSWSYTNMLGLDTNIVVQKATINPSLQAD
jgi:hypothetical protein